MALTEHGYQNYQMWNMFDEGGNASEMQIPLSPGSNSNQVSATTSANGGLTITLQGNFTLGGSTLAEVSGVVTDRSGRVCLNRYS